MSTYLQVSAFGLYAATLPIFAVIAVFFNVHGSNARMAAIVGRYDLRGTKYHVSYAVTPKRNGYRHYVCQIVVISLFCLFFGIVLIESGDVVKNSEPLSFILSGPADHSVLDEKVFGPVRFKTFMLMSFAYLGWLIWSLTTVFSRYRTLEILPSTYNSLIIRLIVAVTIAPLAASLAAVDASKVTIVHLSAFAFAIGMFPETGIAFIKDRAKSVGLAIFRASSSKAIDLSLIEGVTYARKLRLAEVGIEDVQGLAATNPFRILGLSAQSPFEVADWIAQAQLLLVMKPQKFDELRKIGIRNVFHFIQRTRRGIDATPMADAMGLSVPHILGIRQTFLRDPNVNMMAEFVARLARAEPEEQWAKTALPWFSPFASDRRQPLPGDSEIKVAIGELLPDVSPLDADAEEIVAAGNSDGSEGKTSGPLKENGGSGHV